MKLYDELEGAMQEALEATAATVEYYNDQYRNTDKDHAKRYPAVYFELLEPVQFTQSGTQYQQARMRARLHCVVFDLKNNKTAIHDFSQDVFIAMHQRRLKDPENRDLTTEWVRVASTMPERHGNLKVMYIDFEFEAFDYYTLPTNLESAPNFTIQINEPE